MKENYITGEQLIKLDETNTLTEERINKEEIFKIDENGIITYLDGQYCWTLSNFDLSFN